MAEQTGYDRTLDAAMLEQMADYLDTGVLSLDTNFTVRGWNHWLEVASQVPRSEVIGKDITEVFPALAGSPGEAALRAGLTGQTLVLAHKFHRYLLPLPPAPGFESVDRMQQSTRIMPLEENGQIIGVIALIQDVTERVVREDELRKARDMSEQASRAKSDFIASMTHELRTPLTAIIGFADLMEAEVGGNLSDTHKQHVQRMKAGAWHLIGIIDEILTFSRMEAGRLDLMIEHIDVVELARETAAFLEPAASGKRLKMLVDLPDAAVEVDVDPLRVRQVLINLIGNAIKFTERGHVKVAFRCDAARVCFTVSDTGPGIPPEYQNRIFEPFRQVEQSRTRTKGGTGLGLSVSRDLARMMGGDLVIDPAENTMTGASFTLWLPRVEAVKPSSAELPPAHATTL